MQIVTRRGLILTSALMLLLCACDDLSKRLRENHDLASQTSVSPSPSASPSESPEATETPTETPTATPTAEALFDFRNRKISGGEAVSLNSVLKSLGQAGTPSENSATGWLGQDYKKDFPGSSQDTDGDGYIDQLEGAYSTDAEDPSSFPVKITTTSLAKRLRNNDEDGDGLSNADESQRGTSLQNPDSDGDGILDGLEVLANTNPLDSNSRPRDVDQDGLSDDHESSNGYNPTNMDTDADGLSDGFEVALKSSPLDDDTDHDGILDGKEVMLGSDPTIHEGRLDLSR